VLFASILNEKLLKAVTNILKYYHNVKDIFEFVIYSFINKKGVLMKPWNHPGILTFMSCP